MEIAPDGTVSFFISLFSIPLVVIYTFQQNPEGVRPPGFCCVHVREEKALLSFGILGSGNHFIELGQDEGGSRGKIQRDAL